MAVSVATFTALTVVCLTVTITAQIPDFPKITYDAFYDFIDPSNDKNFVHVKMAESFAGTGCSRRGVLKLVLDSEDNTRRRVLVDLFFSNPSGNVFNLGDSRTNNGYARDEDSQSRDAEVHGAGRNMLGWLSDHGRSAAAFNIPSLYETRLILIAGDGHLSWISDKNNQLNYYTNEHLFALNGQVDLQGQDNHDLFLGVNKVVERSSDRVGSGVCQVGIKFLPEF